MPCRCERVIIAPAHMAALFSGFAPVPCWLRPGASHDGHSLRACCRFPELQLILPYLDLKIEYYDLGLPHRDATDDKVTVEAAEAIKVGF